MSGSLAESYPSGNQPLNWRRIKFSLWFGALLPLTLLVGAVPTITLVCGILGIGLSLGLTASSIRDAVVDSGIVAGLSGVLVVLSPVFASIVGLSVSPSVVDLLLLFPVLVVATAVVSLSVWYLDWYLTLRHGSTARAVGLWVSRTDDPQLTRMKRQISIPQLLVGGGSVVLVGILLVAVLAPGVLLGLLPAGFSEPVEPADPTDQPTDPTETVYAGVSVELLQTDAGPAAEIYVFNFGTANTVTVTNERTGEQTVLTPETPEGVFTGTVGDTLTVVGVAGETKSELRTITLQE